MDAEHLQTGIAASEAAAILHVVFAHAGPLNAPVCLPLGGGVAQITRLLALQELARLRVVDFLVAGDQVEVRLRPAWRDFFEMDISRGMPTMPHLHRYGAELRDTEARALIDDTLRRFAAVRGAAAESDATPPAPTTLAGTFRGREWEAEWNPKYGDWWLTFDGQPLGWAHGLPRAMGEAAVRRDLLQLLEHPLPERWDTPPE